MNKKNEKRKQLKEHGIALRLSDGKAPGQALTPYVLDVLLAGVRAVRITKGL